MRRSTIAMIAKYILLFLFALQSINAASQSDKLHFLYWTPTTHFFRETFLNEDDFKLSIINRLFCSKPSFAHPTYQPKGDPQWLTELCAKAPLIKSLAGDEGFFAGLKWRQVANYVTWWLSSVNGEFNALSMYILKCKGLERNEICKHKKDKFIEEVKGHLEEIAKNFKWSDFITLQDTVITIANAIKWDGSDWDPLIKLVKPSFDGLYALDKFLKATDESGTQRRQRILEALKKSQMELVAKLKSSEGEKEIESKIITQNHALFMFDSLLYELCFKENVLFEDNSSRFSFYNEPIIGAPPVDFKSRFFKFGKWQIQTPLETALRYAPKSLSLDQKKLTTMQKMLFACQNPNRQSLYAAPSSLSRASLWHANVRMLNRYIDPADAEIADRLHFFFKYYKAHCGWSEAVESVEIQEKDVDVFVKMIQSVKANLEGPWTFLPDNFLPKLDSNSPNQYGRLSSGNISEDCVQKSLLISNDKWAKFKEALKRNGKCCLPAQDMEAKLEELLKKVEITSEKDVKLLDAKLVEIETGFTSSVEGWLKMRERPFVDWAPLTLFYSDYFVNVGAFKEKIMNNLLCIPSGPANDPLIIPAWLQELCTKSKNAAKIFSDLSKNTEAAELRKDIGKRLAMGGGLEFENDKKKMTMHIVRNVKVPIDEVNQNAISSNLSEVAQKFKWSDFIKPTDEFVKIAESIKWDGSDWEKLAKFYTFIMDSYYSLQTFLNGKTAEDSKDRESLRARLLYLQNKLVQELKQSLECNKDDVVQMIKETDYSMRLFSDTICKLIKEYILARSGEEPNRYLHVFNPVSVETADFKSSFFNKGTWPGTVPMTEVFKKFSIAKSGDPLHTIHRILSSCNYYSPFIFKSAMNRSNLLWRMLFLWNNLINHDDHEKEGLEFFLKNHKLICEWSGETADLKEAVITDKQVESFLQALSEVKKTIGGPIGFLHDDFYPILSDRSDQYAKLSTGKCDNCIQKSLLTTGTWTSFQIDLLDAQGTCLKVAQDTDQNLENIINIMKWDSKEEVENNDKTFKEWEDSFKERVLVCVDERNERIAEKSKETNARSKDIYIAHPRHKEQNVETLLKKITKRKHFGKIVAGVSITVGILFMLIGVLVFACKA